MNLESLRVDFWNPHDCWILEIAEGVEIPFKKGYNCWRHKVTDTKLFCVISPQKLRPARPILQVWGKFADATVHVRVAGCDTLLAFMAQILLWGAVENV